MPIINPDLIQATQFKLNNRGDGATTEEKEEEMEKEQDDGERETCNYAREKYVGWVSTNDITKKMVRRRGYRAVSHPLLRWWQARNDP